MSTDSPREKELKLRLEKLWIDATNSCGGAPSRVIREIKEIEKELEELKEKSGPQTG